MTDSVESVLQKLVVDIKSHILGQYDWRFDVDAWLTSLLRSALEPMLAELHQADGALRKRIHHLEAHNQHFYRCESGWCNPSEKFGGNPAMETMKQIEQRAEAAEQALREARDINHDLASTRFAKWKQLRAENEKLRELLREITHALKLSFAGKNVRCADELISRAEALSPSPTPAPDTNTQSLCHAKPSPDSATPEEKK